MKGVYKSDYVFQLDFISHIDLVKHVQYERRNRTRPLSDSVPAWRPLHAQSLISHHSADGVALVYFGDNDNNSIEFRNRSSILPCT